MKFVLLAIAHSSALAALCALAAFGYAIGEARWVLALLHLCAAFALFSLANLAALSVEAKVEAQ